MGLSVIEIKYIVRVINTIKFNSKIGVDHSYIHVGYMQ